MVHVLLFRKFYRYTVAKSLEIRCQFSTHWHGFNYLCRISCKV